jgi:hypothetical protein
VRAAADQYLSRFFGRQALALPSPAPSNAVVINARRNLRTRAARRWVSSRERRGVGNWNADRGAASPKPADPRATHRPHLTEIWGYRGYRGYRFEIAGFFRYPQIIRLVVPGVPQSMIGFFACSERYRMSGTPIKLDGSVSSQSTATTSRPYWLSGR